MNNIKRLSRAELACELITMPDAPATADATVSYAAGGASIPPPLDAQVSRKLSVARELLLRDLAVTMRKRPVMSSPIAAREWLDPHKSI